MLSFLKTYVLLKIKPLSLVDIKKTATPRVAGIPNIMMKRKNPVGDLSVQLQSKRYKVAIFHLQEKCHKCRKNAILVSHAKQGLWY